jgi:hypothetical protein
MFMHAGIRMHAMLALNLVRVPSTAVLEYFEYEIYM